MARYSSSRSARMQRSFDRDLGSDDISDFDAPRGRRSSSRKPARRYSKSGNGKGSSAYQRGVRAGRREMAAMLSAPDEGYERQDDGYNGRGRRDREVDAPAVRIGYRL